MTTIQEPLQAPNAGTLLGTRVLMKNIERQKDPEASAQAAGMLIRQDVIIFRRRAKVESPLAVAHWMHKRVDRAMLARDEGDPEGTAEVRCTRHCNACCFQHVTLAEPEARLAFSHAQGVGHPLDVERLRKQSANGMDAAAHLRLPYEDRRCVMLKDDGDCAIYANRPTACRTYRVVTDPADCSTETNPGGRVLALSTPGAEIVVSAAMQAFRYGSLAAFMLELIEGGAS